jgi:hypothetical protein
LYYAAAQWMHAGVSVGPNRFKSKWGAYPIYVHGLAEVPAKYGDHVRFFECPSAAEALELFLRYARDSGVCEEHIALTRTGRLT